MISSMTAFSRQTHADEQGELTWELRSVNHRYLEVSVRLPEELRVLEPVVRECMTRRLGRGKLDCNLRFTPAAGAIAGVAVNERLARQIIEAAEVVGHLMHEAVPPEAMDVLRWPGVVEQQSQDLTPVQKQAAALLERTVDELIVVRQREGARLAELVVQRCSAMRVEVERVKVLMPKILDGLRQRLATRLAELSEDLDHGRLEQEMVIQAQKLDIDEEMDRLRTHLDEVERVLKSDEPVGRRLDFLMQELNREANTLASKSSDVESTRVGVELKVLIEQMREQIQNIE
ncbi:MAG: YicC family protein [Gammaproteobacteria bacterium]|nr:YicC family protein [Gammaproteobacteria bacterium]